MGQPPRQHPDQSPRSSSHGRGTSGLSTHGARASSPRAKGGANDRKERSCPVPGTVLDERRAHATAHLPQKPALGKVSRIPFLLALRSLLLLALRSLRCC